VQGESLPLWGTVGQLMDQLTAAGVGERPVVFVCHRWAYCGADIIFIVAPIQQSWMLSDEWMHGRTLKKRKDTEAL